MDQLLFHPKVVHFPIALAALIPLIAGGVTLAVLRGWLDRRAWAMVCLLQGSMFGSGLLAMYTGGEEECVEQIVPERHVEAHEEAAELFVWASAIVLASRLVDAQVRAFPMHTRDEALLWVGEGPGAI